MHDTSTVTDPPARSRRILRYTRPLRGSLAVSAVLVAVFIGYTWLVVHWSPFIRLDHTMDRNWDVSSFWPVLSRVDHIGQRAVCLPILVVVVVVTSWRHRSWRPAVLAAIGVFTVNLMVLIAKTAMARGRPLTGRGFFTGGEMYPSGHTANVIVVYGLCFYLITHYGAASPRVKRALFWLVVVMSIVMFTTSLMLRWHWFSDLVGGFMVGGAVLALTIGIDAAMPFESHRLVVVPPTPAPPPESHPAPEQQPEPQPHPAHPVEVRDTVMLSRTRPGSPAASADRRSGH